LKTFVAREKKGKEYYFGQPFSLAYFKHERCPFSAAHAHVRISHGHPFSLAYFKHSK
jgi:hypothetical protein